MTTAERADIAITRLESAELEAILDGVGTADIRAEAFKELSRRGAESLPRRAETLLQDESATPALRSAASVALGKRPVSANGQKALLGVLRDPNPSLVRKATTALGRIGDLAALEALAQIKLEVDHPAWRALTFARSLIAYRHGLREHLLRGPGPEHLLKTDPRAAQPIVWQALEAEELRHEAVNLARQLPGIAFSYKTAMRFKCGTDYWLVFNAELDNAGAFSNLAQRSAILAVTMRLNPCSGNHYVDEYIAANPAVNGKGELIGVRPSGSIVHSGGYDLGNDVLTFSLHATDTPYSRALDLAGSLPAGGRPPVLEKSSVMPGRVKEQARWRRPRKDD